MAFHNIDDFDPSPKVRVVVAQGDLENRTSREWFAMQAMKLSANWENVPNDDFIALCYEPEMLADMTPLERELLARLAGAWEMACNPNAGLED